MHNEETDIDSPKASFDRANTFLRAGDAPMAERICRQALNEHPRDANLLCLLGASLIRQRNIDTTVALALLTATHNGGRDERRDIGY